MENILVVRCPGYPEWAKRDQLATPAHPSSTFCSTESKVCETNKLVCSGNLLGFISEMTLKMVTLVFLHMRISENKDDIKYFEKYT